MGTPYIWACDLCRGQYGYVHSSTTGYASSYNAIDGNPNNRWAPGSTTPSFIWGTGATYNYLALGLAGHNLPSSSTVTVSFSTTATGSYTTIGSFTTSGPEDVVWPFTTTGARHWIKVAFSSSANVTVGEISLLADYGYSAAGVLTEAGNYGKLALANEVAQGLRYPIGRSANGAVASVATAGGAIVDQRIGRGVQTWDLSLGQMRGADDTELWKIVQSYDYPTATLYTNPNWQKGVWLTDDQWDGGTTKRAWYCKPEGGIVWQPDMPGGRASATIRLRTYGRA